jgi:hypothetical protein
MLETRVTYVSDARNSCALNKLLFVVLQYRWRKLFNSVCWRVGVRSYGPC